MPISRACINPPGLDTVSHETATFNSDLNPQGTQMDSTSYITVNFGLVLIGYVAGFALFCTIFPSNAKVIWKFAKDFVARLRK